jgi:Zn-dependent alcohol dehydrogenase
VLAAGSSDASAVTSSSGSNGSIGSSENVLEGKTVCVVGAGGAGRALAFGAASKGAKVIIANRCVCVVVGWCFMGVRTVLRGLLEVTATSVSAAVESGSKGTEICRQVCTPARYPARECTASVLRDARVRLRSCCLDGR